MSPAFEVRPCTEPDVAVLDRCIPTGRNDVHAAFLARSADPGDVTYLVAWRGDEPYGTGLVRWTGLHERHPGVRSPEAPEISNLHVRPERQGLGAGTALIAAAEEHIAARGHRHSAIGVDLANAGAARLYERLGYVDTGGRWTQSYTYFDADGVQRSATEQVRILVRALS